ncbi:MAG: DUF692 family protein [Acidobacteria bacterium]|nr:DUF692 family protein [Acidobacteriota bacterium]
MAEKISVGAFYNPHLAGEILDAAGRIDHLAMADPPRKDDEYFPKIREKFVLLLHDYIGQLSDPVPPHALERAKRLAELYRSPWIAEHFQCVLTQDGRYNVDYVFPPLYTREFLQRYIRNALDLQREVGRPLVIESIPRYFAIHLDEMTEGEFLRRFFEATGCGFLLDTAHAWLGAHYQRRPARDYLAELPLDCVTELHIAGVAEYSALEGPWIGPVEPTDEILDLSAWAVERMPRLRAVTFDAFSTLLQPGTIVRSVERIRDRLGLS